MEALLNIDTNATPFYFQQALNIDAINNETKCIDRKAHLFWEIPVIDAKINDLMNTLSQSGKAAARLEIVRIQEDFSWLKRKNRKKELDRN